MSTGSHYQLGLAAAVFAAGLAFATPGQADVLVYDEDTVRQFAQTAANNLGGTVVVAGELDFNTQLISQAWEYVLVDAPGTAPPSGGWDPLINFISGGGRVVMSYWDWDNDPELWPAFGVTSASSFSLIGQTLGDTGASAIFTGVTMPNADWSDYWSDDGDGFGLAGGSLGLATLSGVADPVVVLGNGGRTIASFLIDEAGATWTNDGSAVRLWENMILAVTDSDSTPIPEPASLALLGLGLAGIGIARRRKGA